MQKIDGLETLICVFILDDSCRPNLKPRLVVVESQLAHVGMFANLDVSSMFLIKSVIFSYIYIC